MNLSPEVLAIAQRLRLSQGDLLGIAREIAADDTLRSPEELNPFQQRCLMDILQMLAQPVSMFHWSDTLVA